MRMMVDLHNLQLPLLCQLSRSAPNILWSVGSSLQNQFLQVGGDNPAVMAARISFKSLLANPVLPNSVLESQAATPSGAARTAAEAAAAEILPRP
jgi:hypothetical protein